MSNGNLKINDSSGALTGIPVLFPLLPKQISENWAYIQAGIKASVLDGKVMTDRELTDILQGLVLRRMQCWFGGLSTETEDHQVSFEPYVMAITTLMNKNLVVIGLVEYAPVGRDLGMALVAQLRDFAKAWGCKIITSVTTQPAVIEAAKSVGSTADYTVLSLEV